VPGRARRQRARPRCRISRARKEAVVKAAGGRLWSNLKIAVLSHDVVSCAEPASPHRVADVTAPTSFRAAVALTGAAPFVMEAVGWPRRERHQRWSASGPQLDLVH